MLFLQDFGRFDLKVHVKSGAFDDAVKGVDAIIHTASPVRLYADDPSGTLRLPCEELFLQSQTELIEPAVGGVEGILKSALKNGRYASLVQ